MISPGPSGPTHTWGRGQKGAQRTHSLKGRLSGMHIWSRTPWCTLRCCSQSWGSSPIYSLDKVYLCLWKQKLAQCWLCWDSCTYLRGFQLIIPLNFQTEFCSGQRKFTALNLSIAWLLSEQGTSQSSFFYPFPLNHHNLFVNKENNGAFGYFSTQFSHLHEHSLLYERHQLLQGAA